MRPRPDPPEETAAAPLMGGLVPIPDPTTLTNQLVARAVAGLREVLETRLDASDKAVTELNHTTDARVAAAVTQVKELYAEKFRLVEGSIEANRLAVADRIEANRLAVIDRFELLDRQTIKAAADVKSAVDAAFAAAAAGVSQQNEANFLASQKQELAFTKQIDQLAASVVQISKANDDKPNDLKDRLVAMEGRSSISDPNTTAALREMSQTIAALKQSNDQGSGAYRQRTDSNAWIFSAIAAVGVIAMIAIEMFRSH